jgi:hypothetical protein
MKKNILVQACIDVKNDLFAVPWETTAWAMIFSSIFPILQALEYHSELMMCDVGVFRGRMLSGLCV